MTDEKLLGGLLTRIEVMLSGLEANTFRSSDGRIVVIPDHGKLAQIGIPLFGDTAPNKT